MDFGTILNTVFNYLNETWQTKWQQHTIGNLGQVMLILAPLTHLFSETEQQTILKLLREIKHLYPGNKIFFSSALYFFKFLMISLNFYVQKEIKTFSCFEKNK